MPDGTVKQVNPFTGTQVWTVPGRADRPLVLPPVRPPRPLVPTDRERSCAFCQRRYLETPPEHERVVRDGDGWGRLSALPAARLFETEAEFRLFANLFEIVSYDYWRANHGYRPPAEAEQRLTTYLGTPEGRAHVRGLLPEAVTDADLPDHARRFFAGCHDVVAARRHFVDGATYDDQLAGSGDLSPGEHEQYVALTVRAMSRLYEANPHVRLVAAFQNWLRPAGASFDHLHKQLVGIDEYGTDLRSQLARLEAEPDLYERWGPRYAASQGLVLARNEHAVAIVGVGHRFPGVEVWSRVPGRPWELSARVLRDLSDLLHALHAATGSRVPTNEEWHHEPPGGVFDSPMRVVVKWRVSTLAGFEGGTRIYLNTIDPWTMRERVLVRLTELQQAGRLGDVRLEPGG
jgi:galactose-1-phosphate uridylyltransferase